MGRKDGEHWFNPIQCWGPPPQVWSKWFQQWKGSRGRRLSPWPQSFPAHFLPGEWDGEDGVGSAVGVGQWPSISETGSCEVKLTVWVYFDAQEITTTTRTTTTTFHCGSKTLWGAKTPRSTRMGWDVVHKEGFPEGFGADIHFSGVPGSLLIGTNKNQEGKSRDSPRALKNSVFCAWG